MGGPQLHERVSVYVPVPPHGALQSVCGVQGVHAQVLQGKQSGQVQLSPSSQNPSLSQGEVRGGSQSLSVPGAVPG